MNIGVNQAITLLPVKLEIRKVLTDRAQGEPSPILEEPKHNTGWLGGLIQKGARALRMRRMEHEYWIRWYPDEIHLPPPVGPITAEEQQAWNDADPAALLELVDLPSADALEQRPAVKEAWIQFCKTVGSPARAFQVARYFKSGKRDWNFDAEDDCSVPLFEITNPSLVQLIESQGLTGAALEELKQGFRAHGIKTAGVFTAIEGERWAFADPGNKHRYRIQDDHGSLWVFQKPASPAGMVFGKGIRVPTFPERVQLHAVQKDLGGRYISQPVCEDIPVKNNQLFLSIAGDSHNSGNWITDFQAASDLGMGIKIQDTSKVRLIDTAEWLILFGAQGEGMDGFEEILRRNNALGRTAFVPQDTSTNNTDETTVSYTPYETDALAFFKSRRPSSAGAEVDPAQTNRAVVSTALGIPPKAFDDIPFWSDTEGDDAEQMAALLWDSCMSVYFSGTLAGGLISPSKRFLGDFFSHHLRSRGPLPVLRVGKNPYGILPVMSTKALPPVADDKILKIADFINDLKTDFLNLTELVPVMDGSPDDNENFPEILKTTSVSSSFHIRALPYTKDTLPSMLNCPLVAYRGTMEYLGLQGNDFAALLEGESDMDTPALLRILRNYVRSITNEEEKKTAIGSLQIPANRLARIADPAKLNMLFAETMDLFSHRLDAWATGVAGHFLENKARGPIGVYGWLEKPGTIDASRDIESEYIQAPSEGQVNTLAVLRNAALASGTQEEKRPFNINLSSEQVQRGAEYLDAVRKGHLPGEVLGYLLERMIHDSDKLDDGKIFDLRKKYSITVQEAEEFGERGTHYSKVIDAERFIADPSTSRGELGRIKTVLSKTKDAAADIALAETTYALMRGDLDTASGWMDFLDGKINPPPNEFIHTQRKTKIHGSKVFQFFDYPEYIEGKYLRRVEQGEAVDPQAMAEPVLANYCESMMGGFPDAILAIRTSKKDGGGPAYHKVISMGDLEFSAFDLVVQGTQHLETKLKNHALGLWLNNRDHCQSLIGVPGEHDHIEGFFSEVNIEIAGWDDPNFKNFSATADRIRKILQKNRPDGRSRPDETVLSFMADGAMKDAAQTRRILQGRLSQLRQALDALRQNIRIGMTNCRMAENRKLLDESVSAKDCLGSLKDFAIENLQTENRKDAFLADFMNYLSLLPQAAGITIDQLSALFDELGRFIRRWNEITSGCGWNTSGGEESVAAKVNRIGKTLVNAQTGVGAMANSNDFAGYPGVVTGLDGVKNAIQDLQTVCRGNQNLKDYYFQSIKANLDDLMGKLDGGLHTKVASSAQQLEQSLNSGDDAKSIRDGADEMRMNVDPAVKFFTSAVIDSGVALAQSDPPLPQAAKFGIPEALRPVFLPWTAAQSIGLYITVEIVAKKIDEKIRAMDENPGDPILLLQETTGDKAALVVLEPIFKQTADGSIQLWDLSGRIGPMRGAMDTLSPFTTVKPALRDFLNLVSNPIFIFGYELASPEAAGEKQSDVDFYFAILSGYKPDPAGLVFIRIEEWQEFIPDSEQSTGVGVKYNGPKAEAPNLILIAISPKTSLLPIPSGAAADTNPSDPHGDRPLSPPPIQQLWTNAMLADVLTETIELMKIRMITSEEVLSSDILWKFLPVPIFAPDKNGELLFPTLILGMFSQWPFLDQFISKGKLNQGQLDLLNRKPSGIR